MGPWIEIYDSEGVQLDLRHAFATHSAAIAAAVSIAVFIGSMVGISALPHETFFLAVGVACLCAAVYATGRLASLQSRVWCLKMSPHMIMGYNHSRKATVFAWSQVDYVEVGEGSISIVAGSHTMIEVPAAFDDYSHIAHRIIDLAELHRRPVHLGGQSMTDIDPYALMPELRTMLTDPLASHPESA